MANSKQKSDQLSTQSQSPEEVQTKADSQVNLMGSAAVDPQPLLDEENDPIAEQVKESSHPEE